MELLSPAKNLEIGIAAINCGADAVYIGASDFGARKSASNSVADIEKLVNYAHFYGSKVFVTFNTILYDNELQAAEKLIWDLYNVGVDALIIQDLGILEMNIPPIELHASTQMHNYDIRRIKFFDDLGFKRIVLARECSLEKIREVRKSIKAEIECFVHGALCVSFSGQCYMSAKIGGRSANRGECAQACRLKYSLLNIDNKLLIKDSYLLSLKDFALYEHLKQMMNAGVNSLKIEGRLKDVSYVSDVTAFYRKAIDSMLENQKKDSSGKCFYDFEPDVNKVFNRGFTKYFFLPEVGKMANFVSPKSMGEYLGKLTSKKGNLLTINTKSKLSNGDGMCFIKNNQLFGFRADKVSGNLVEANTDKNLTVGTEIYRNLDTEFQKKIEHSKTLRKVGLDLKLNLCREDFSVEITDEDNLSVKMAVPFEFQLAKDSAKSLENIRQNLLKVGDKFYVRDVKTEIKNSEEVPFIPNSVISELRRNLLEKLSEIRLKHFVHRDSEKPQHPDLKYFLQSGDYKLNVANKLAKQFYEKHGCEVKQSAFELLKDNRKQEVMTTKYCIRRELGFCLKTNPDVPQEWKSDKFELQGPYENFVLKFDCKDCVMRIYSK